MNRRAFLKAVGLTIAAPGAVLGAVKAVPPVGVDPTISGEEFTVAMIQEIVRKRLRDSPTTYYIFIHPKQHSALKVMIARDKYKHERWLIRHNRWLERQRRPPIHCEKPEYGVWGGVQIIETDPEEKKGIY